MLAEVGLIYQTALSPDPTKPVSILRNVSWSSYASSVAVHYPYILSLQAEEIEIHSSLTWKHQQSLNLSQTLSPLRAFAEGSADQYLIAFSKKGIWALRSTPFPQQVRSPVQ